MRISGWLLGVLGLGAVIFGTSLCALVTYGSVRTVLVDLWDSGIRVESPMEVANAVFNPGSVAVPTATPTPNEEALIVIPSITPVATGAAVVDAQPTPDASAASVDVQPTPTEEAPVVVALDPAAQYRWDDPRQIRILLLGIDQRSATGDRGPFRSDTMILISVDPVRKTAGVVSIPRDLWVNIPNFTPERINTANFLGDANAYPGGGGPALAMETVAANFGIRVDHFLLVNFDVFYAVVDTLAPNGVEVCVREQIYDPKYPDAAFGTIVVEFQPGCQRLNSERLLQYARTRVTQGGDFDRARRQQEVLDAARAELLSLGGVTNFLGQIPALWGQLADNYKTNLTVEEIISLGFLMGEIARDDIRYAVIDNNYIDFGKSPTGEDILLPNWTRINEMVQRIFYPQVQVSRADLLTRSQAEAAVVRVYNGTDIAGLAGRTQEWLMGRGVRIEGVGNDPNHNSAPTVIKDYGNNRYTALYLADLLGLPPERIIPGTDGLAANGIIVVAGPDIQSLLSAQP